jgi:hypothetical protein
MRTTPAPARCAGSTSHSDPGCGPVGMGDGVMPRAGHTPAKPEMLCVAVAERSFEVTLCPWSWLSGKSTLADVRTTDLREDQNMKPLSESLTDLAARVKRVEDSAAAVREKNRAALQARREELDAVIEREANEFEKTMTEAREAAQTWWSDTKNAIERQIAAMRTDFQKRQAELKEKNAERAARDAEADAVAAITLAAYGLDAAEWAVVRAELARGEADELAMRS